MKSIKTGILAFFIMAACLTAAGQPATRITGVVVDSVTGTPVEFAHIQNFSRNRQIYSNSSGNFRLDVSAGDTLIIYGPGYFYEKLEVNESMLSGDTVKIYLTAQPYNLAAANILGIASYDQFRNKLINEPPAKTEAYMLNENLSGPVILAAKEGFEEYKQKYPSIVSIAIRTPEEKERIKLAKIKQKEQVRDQVYEKFNPLIVKKITGLSDDDLIIEFMQFCDFKDSYLLEVNEYDLTERIAAKFELFKKKKEDEKHRRDSLNFVEDFFRSLA